MKKIFKLEDLIPKLGFKITHKDMCLPDIGIFKKLGYKYDFDVPLESKGVGVNLQRPLCWTLEQKREFVLSILKGIFIPQVAIVVYSSETEKHDLYKVIDGKQRLHTAMSFLDDEFSIVVNGEEYLFSELPENVQFRYKSWTPRAQIAYSYWDDKISDDDLIRWFDLINFAGTEQDADHKSRLRNYLSK